MSSRGSDARRRMTEEYKDIYNELYYVAYAVTGNDRAAEEALISVMLDTGAAVDARASVIERALMLKSRFSAEQNFYCFLDSPTDTPNAIADWLSGESDETRRCVMLKYGCRLSPGDIASATDMTVASVKRVLLSVRKSAERFTRGADKALFAISAREIKKNALAPDFNSMLHAAEAHDETYRKNSSHKPVGRIVSWVAAAIMLFILGTIIWLSAVMLNYYREPSGAGSTQTVGYVITTSEVPDARF